MLKLVAILQEFEWDKIYKQAFEMTFLDVLSVCFLMRMLTNIELSLDENDFVSNMSMKKRTCVKLSEGRSLKDLLLHNLSRECSEQVVN